MWDVLAIAPTDDAKAIRRAYAARLREIDPDREREAFARLRAALEWALAAARRAQPPRDEPPADAQLAAVPLDGEPPQTIETVYLDWAPDPRGPSQPQREKASAGDEEPSPDAQTVNIHWTTPQPPAREAAGEIASERAQERTLLIALEKALQRGEAREAAPLYFRAAATGAVPLGDTERMLVRVFAVALDDATFDGAAFRGLAKTLAWDKPRLEGAAVSDVQQRVLARLAAEDWYDGLVATAERKKRSTPRAQAKAARLILRRIGGVGLLRINRPALRAFLDQLKPHQAWLRDRITPAWTTVLERRMRRRDLIAGGLAVLFIGGFLLNAIAVGTVTAFRDGFSPGLPLLGVLAALLAWFLKILVVGYVQRWRQRVP
jgi:hypothetical protein